jgi:hypothetical protein
VLLILASVDLTLFAVLGRYPLSARRTPVVRFLRGTEKVIAGYHPVRNKMAFLSTVLEEKYTNE